jgi:hypothetical protein
MRTFDSWHQVQSTQNTNRSKRNFLFGAALSRRMRSTVAIQILISFFPPKINSRLFFKDQPIPSAVDEFIPAIRTPDTSSLDRHFQTQM